MQASLPRLALPAALLLLSACFDRGGVKLEDDTAAGAPSLTTEPELLDFGELSLGESATESFHIGNAGDAALSISGIQLSEGTVSFTLLNETTSLELDPGDSAEILVAFEPVTAGEVTAAAIVSSNDPDRPAATVTLLGSTAVGELGFELSSYDFGTIAADCEALAELTLRNSGEASVELSALEISGDSFTLLTEAPLPTVIEPGTAVITTVSFAPEAEGSHNGELLAETSEGTEASVLLLGEATAPVTRSETFEVEDLPVDLLFSADQSGSMDDDLYSLASMFERFLTELEGTSSDWQILVANDDDGCTDSGILSPHHPDPDGTFSSAINQGGGYHTESLLTVAATALEATGSGECNHGFLREEALLHVVLVSDEPEQSSASWATLVTRMQAVKASSEQLRISAVAGDYPSGCGSASAGTGYYEAVEATGGEFLSICGSWSTNVTALARASTWGWRFELSEEPAPGSIRVWVDDVATTEGWAWDASEGAVVFEQGWYVEPGSTVYIEYATAECES
jgi:hypothetical protein